MKSKKNRSTARARKSEKAGRPRVPPVMAVWIAVRRRLHLSDAHIQMARELGFEAEQLPRLASVRDQPWKMALTDYLEHLYRKRFKRDQPDPVRSIEEMLIEKKESRRRARAARSTSDGSASTLEASPIVAQTVPSETIEGPREAADDSSTDASRAARDRGRRSST